MEDHTNTSRLAVSATFTRGMNNFQVDPQRSPSNCEVTIYHGMPHGLCDELRRPVTPEERAALGIPEGLVRYSVGIEDPADLMADLEQALAADSRFEDGPRIYQKGDAEAALAEADNVIEDTFYVHRHSTQPIEPRGHMAHWETDGTLTL